jgi:hypothetical protein
LDTGGFFKFPAVFEGDYPVRIGLPREEACLKTISDGGADASGSPLMV